jgi:SAM-dependent methyltransferase
VDFIQDFLEVLECRAEKRGLSAKVSTLCCSMDNLPFGDEEFDVIWSEGAIYNIGFDRGVKDWNRHLKPGGRLVVSEITWTTGTRPPELEKYWDDQYPEIDVASSKVSILEKNGYSPRGYFVLPEHCWLENYYRPMQDSFKDFLSRNGNSEEARAIVEAEKREIKMYEKYKTHYSYGVYIARKLN